MSPIYSEKEVAEHYGISARTLKRWREEGGGPEYVRLGRRRIAYTDAALAAWTAARSHAHRAAEMAKETADSG
ncbi:AlpA family transcriptional regulator [Belnapia sp. F-4-1]|uniref:helix-turn-helix transcriptional regulator n=1 Tax=Belnapia sp. F-4-1 TaxID=1545443 RepID=UPI001186DD56|nr:helix-turn-helix domain-containing protein [Belnapia sp. F-4-1]